MRVRWGRGPIARPEPIEARRDRIYRWRSPFDPSGGPPGRLFIFLPKHGIVMLVDRESTGVRDEHSEEVEKHSLRDRDYVGS